jgi:hypothetical protein
VHAAEHAARRSHLPDDDATWRTRRCDYFHLLKIKRESFWRQLMDDAQGQPRVLWSAFTTLLGCSRAPAADAIDAAVFHDFFDIKVAAVRNSTAGAGPPTCWRAATDSELSSFVGVSGADVVATSHRLAA